MIMKYGCHIHYEINCINEIPLELLEKFNFVSYNLFKPSYNFLLYYVEIKF